MARFRQDTPYALTRVPDHEEDRDWNALAHLARVREAFDRAVQARLDAVGPEDDTLNVCL
jgi:hypothetical protein